MTEEVTTESSETETPVESKTSRIKRPENVLRTILFSIIGALLFLVLDVVQWPYTSIDLFKLGFAPALALVASVGAVRGPLTGFLTGYIGKLLSDIVLSGGLVAFTLYGFAFGVLGLIVGIASYDLAKGRSLIKLSIMSAIGLIFAALLTVVFGLFVERVASLVSIGFQLLPLLTVGLPTVILLTPLFVRIWQFAMSRPTEESEASE
ncbi:MAG: hypothetical protein ACW960_03890 [Candidatus Thorarchaeota archaeon]|jgi:energy-coupling factor transport system substrate-specific component